MGGRGTVKKEGAGEGASLRLLPSYATSSVLLILLLFALAASPFRGRTLDFGLWTALLVGLPPTLWTSLATSTSKMSPKIPLTNACRSPVAGSPSTTSPG